MQKLSLFHSKTVYWFLLLLFYHTTANGQEEASPMYFDHLTIQNGLSHNTVHCLLQDQYGYIWIGTQNGLNKYDGYTFEVHRSNGQAPDESGFMGKTISALYEDRAGNLWVGTRKQGINFRAKSSDRFVNLQSDSVFAPIKGYEIFDFFEDKAGNIWIGTIGGGLLKYVPSDDSIQHFNKKNNDLHSDFVFDIVEDTEGIIWVATAGTGINYLQTNGKFKTVNVSAPNMTNVEGYRKKLYLEGDNLWIGTEGTGLYRMDIPSKSFKHFATWTGANALRADAVRDIHYTEEGKLFLATDGGGLNVYDTKHDKMWRYVYQANDVTALNSNALLCFLEDRTGSIWIGTYDGGINVYKTNKTWFNFYSPTLKRGEELEHRSILALHQGKDGKVWVGTDGGGLTWIGSQSHRFATPFQANFNDSQTIAGNVVKTIFEDNQNRLWIGTFGNGMSLYQPETNTFKQFDSSNGLIVNNVWSIAQRKDNTLWIGTLGGGIHVLHPESGKFSYYSHDSDDSNSLAEVKIMVVFVDKDNQVWVGTAESGLDLWDELHQRFVHYQYNPTDSLSLSDNEVRAIFQDSRGEIWVGTEGGGVNRWMGGGRFERINEDKGLIANSVMGITEDANGMIWISTFKGLSRFDPNTQSIRNFDFSRRRHSNQFNQMAALTTTDGELFFGGINGLHAIRPEELKEGTTTAPILFTDFKVFNQSIPVGVLPDGYTILNQPIEEAERLTLSYFDNSFSIDFAVMDFTQPLENTFAYKMEGFDEQWQTSNVGQHSATYTNLDPDAYVFKVRYKEEEASIEIYIQPPFWQTWWFRTIALTFIGGLIGGGMYLFVQRRETEYSRRILAAKSEILELRNKNLETEQQNLQLNNEKLEAQRENLQLRNENLETQQKNLQLTNETLQTQQENLQLRNENLETQQENLQLNNEKLATELEAKNSKLMFSAVQMAHKNEILTKVKKELRNFQKSPDTKLLRQLQRMLDHELQSEDYWEEFNVYFNQVDQNFVQTILKKHPQLTKNDLRLCTLMRINLSTKEIASLLNVSVRGVEQSRYRLKKRIGLEKEEDLLKYVVEF